MISDGGIILLWGVLVMGGFLGYLFIRSRIQLQEEILHRIDRLISILERRFQ